MGEEEDLSFKHNEKLCLLDVVFLSFHAIFLIEITNENQFDEAKKIYLRMNS